MAPSQYTSCLINLLECPRILENLCRMSPSAPIRLQRLCKDLNDFFTDEKLSEYLPRSFEQLGLYYSDPFTHCRNGDVESLWMMLVHGIDPRVLDNNGETLIQAAAQSGSVPVVHMLMERGCSLSSKGAFGYTALHQVAYTSHAKLCEFILSHGGNMDALSQNGSTPLLIAAREGNPEVVRAMLRYGADPSDGGDKGISPLLMAAVEGHLEVVRLLLSYGANANEPGLVEGRTPLHEAAGSGHFEVCRVLIEEGGAKVTAVDYQIACENKRQDILSLLRSEESCRLRVLPAPSAAVAN